MAGLRFNIDADLTRFSQLVKKIQETRKELEKLSKSSPKYDKLYAEFKRIKSELETMQKKFAEIQAALAQVDLAKGVVESSKKIRKQTDETSETIKHYADSLNGVREQLKQVTNEINSMSEAQRKSVSGENAVKQYAGLKAQLKVAADEMRGFAKEQENIIKIQQASDGSLTQLRRQLSLLTVQYDNLSRDLRSGATGKELIVQIQAVTKELSEAEQASGRFYRNVGNYASGWNGLNVQVQQLARELPSLAVSMNTFFLAISNNLPMLIDEIKLAKDRLAELKKEGKEGTPVWKQLTKSLLSWQTALVVGITLLSSYGSEIADWVKELFKAKENVDILKESLKAYNEAVITGKKDAQRQLTELKLLYDAAVDAAKGTDERTKAVKKLKDEYPDYFKNLDNETVLAGEAKSAYDRLTQSIMANAKAKAAMEAITDNQRKILDKEVELQEKYSELEKKRSEYFEAAKEHESGKNVITALQLDAARNSVENIEGEIGSLINEIYRLQKVGKDIEGSVNISDLLFDPNSGKGGGGTDGNGSYLDSYQQKKAVQKAEQDIQDAVTDSQLNAQKAVIALMEDGNAKELAQINANYDAKVNEIRKRERELLQTLQDAEYERWKQENPDYRKKGLQFVPTVTALPADQQAGFDKEYSNAYRQQQNDTARLLSDMLAKYRDFAARRTDIEKQMNEDISFLQSQRTEANSDEIDRAIQVAKDKAKEAVQAVTDEENKALAGQDNTFLKMLFGDVSQMAFSDLSNFISQARQLRDYLSGKVDKEGITFISPEQLKAIEESPAELEKLKKALDHLLGTGKKSDFEKIFDTFKKGFADLQSAKGFKDISGAIGTISGAAGDAAGELSEMFDAMGNTAVADALGGVQQVMNAVSNIGQGFAKGGIVGGIAAAVGEAANFIGQAFAANQRHKEALKQVMNEAIAQQREYNLLLMQQNLLYEKATTIFGTDAYSKAANSVNVMKDAISELNEALKGTSEQQEKQNTKPILGRMMNGVTGYYSELKSLYAGLADVDIKTGHKKTGLFGWGKGKDIYSSVLDVYPELISANGDFNKELAETIINTREMSDEDKAALQNMIDLAEQAEEAYEALNDYMTDIFGELGGSMSDALVDAFKNGTDAASAFADSVSDMLETLAEQMVYSVTLAPIMEEAQSAMLDVMKDTGLSEEQKFSKWTDILGGLISDVTEQQQIADRLYQQFKESAKEQGFDIFIPDSGEYASAIEGLEELQKAYEKLSEASSKAFSSEAVKILKQQNENLNEQISLIRKRIDEENRSANPDTDYLDELKGQLEDINDQIEDNKEAMKDAIFGEDIQSAISNFVSAYTEALGDGGSMQKMSKDFVESMVKSMVTESMKADSSPVMENIREKLIEAWKDGVVTADEQLSIEEIVNNLNKELSDKYGWAEGLFGESDIEGLEALQDAYDKLSDSVSEAYSSEKAELLKQQSEILRQQRDLILERLEAEKALGERGDASLVNEWEEQLEEVNSKIEENKESQLDAIFGQDTQTQISNLANALIDVWSGAKKQADSAKDFINGIIKSMVLESLMLDLTPFIDSLREQMAEMFEDGIISADEGDALAGMVEGVMNSLEKQYEWADRFIKEEEDVVQTVEEVAETFSNITFESMRDDFTSQLSDMTSSYEDMCNNFEDKLKESIIKGFIKSKYQNQIQNLISTWDMYGASGNIDSDEMEKLREQYKELISSMIKDRDELAEQFGWSRFQQEATSNGFESMSQDTGEELNGRFTAMYESNLRIKGATEEQTAVLRDILESLSGQTIREVTSLPSDVGGGFDSEKQREAINNSYSPQINVSFPTGQLDELVTKVKELDMKVNNLVNFGSESLLESRQIREYTEKVTKQIPQASKDITRTIDNKL